MFFRIQRRSNPSFTGALRLMFLGVRVTERTDLLND